MQHLLGLISDFSPPNKVWVGKWHFRADINLLVDRKEEEKTVLKISTGPKPLPYRNYKNSKTPPKNPERRCIGKKYHEWHNSKNSETNQSHIFSLSFNERSIFPSNNNDWGKWGAPGAQLIKSCKILRWAGVAREGAWQLKLYTA